MHLSYNVLSHLSTLKITPVDLSRYLHKEKGFEEDCKMISDSLHRYGVCVVKDPRCPNQEKENFLDIMEKYFQDRSFKRDQGIQNVDLGPENSFTGLYYEGKETFTSYSKQKAKFLPPNHSVTPDVPVPDPTWRYRWFVDSDKNIIPSDFKNWEETMNSWGRKNMDCCITFAQMAALGFGIEKDFFLNSIKNGFGHLSPTGLDLTKMKVGQVMTAFHYDFDLMTIHGKPRFSGLFIWLNTGEKVKVWVPDGHLLIQAGKQFEWLTGGYVKAGWHQVVFTEEVKKQRDEAIQKGRIPWRVSSVLFYQIDGNYIMKPHPRFTDEPQSKNYPAIKAEDYLSKQLYVLTGEKW